MSGAATVDEYSGCEISDIAIAIGYADTDAERERAIAAFLRRLPAQPSTNPAAGSGHTGSVQPGQELFAAPAPLGHNSNSAPLRELLDEELEPYRKRRDELVQVAETAVVADDESAGKVVDLGQLCRAFETEIDERRKVLIRPHVEAQKLINDSHNKLRLDVQIVRQGMTGIGGLRGLLIAWDDKKKAATEEARQKAEREARAKAIAAEENRRKAEQAAGGKGAVSAELAAMRAEEAAEHAARQAESIHAEPTRGHLGQVSRKREIRFEITDQLAFATWLIGQPGLQNNFLQALSTICGVHLRSLGVEAIAAGIEIPGVVARVEQGGIIVRR